MNLLSLAKSSFDQETLSNLPTLLGVETEVLPKLIEEALPALFAILKKAASDPQKSDLLTQFLTEIDSSILDNPNEILAEHGPQLMHSGKSGLAKLLGPQLTDYIAPLAKSTGLGEGKIASALGTLAPFIFALLSKEANNAESLNALLADQDLNAATPDTKAPVKAASPEKSYLPDPTKKKERRPRKKRRLAILGVIVALLGGGGFYLSEAQPEWLKDIPLLDNLLEEPENDEAIPVE